MKRLMLPLLAALGLVASVQAQQNPVTTYQLNSTYYVKQVPGFLPTIQSAVAKACGAVGATVDIPAGASPADTIGAVTDGCTTANIVDERDTPATTYHWNGSAYVAVGGGGGATLPTNALVYGLSSTTSRAATNSDVATLIRTATGCNVSGNVWVPQSNTCITPSGGGGSPAGSTGAVQTNGGSGAFGDSGCTASSGLMACPNGFAGAGSTAAALHLGQGTAPAVTANAVSHVGPTSVSTAYNLADPGAPPTSSNQVEQCTNASGQVTCTWATVSGGGGGSASIVYASSCAAGNVDLNTGLQPNGSAATDDSACLDGLIAAATPTNPITLILDKPSLGSIHGPAGGGWGVKAAAPGGIGRVIITGYSITSNVVTFTTKPQTLALNNTVMLGLFGSSTFFNGQRVKVLSAGLTSTQFEASFTHANASATEAGEADYLYGDGLFAPNGLNDDVISNHATGQPGACVSAGGHLWSDPGWGTPGLAPSRGSGFWLDGVVINGNRGNGTVGNSTSGTPQGVGIFGTLYTQPYCWYMGVNIGNLDNVSVRNSIFYQTPAYNVRLSNTQYDVVEDNTFSGVFPNQPVGAENGDGIHFSGPTSHARVHHNYFRTTDDAVAFNAAEGWVGPQTDLTFDHNTFDQAQTGGRMYTGGVAPPAGDAIPSISNVIWDSNVGTVNVVGLLTGLEEPSTLTLVDSINNVSFAHNRICSPSFAWLQENMGAFASEDNGWECGTNGQGMFVTSTNNLTLRDFSSVNDYINHSPSGASGNSLLDMLAGAFGIPAPVVTVVGLHTVGFHVVDTGGSTYGTIPYEVVMNATSTVAYWLDANLDYAHVVKPIPANRESRVTTSQPAVFDTNSGSAGASSNIVAYFSSSLNTNTALDILNRSSSNHWNIVINGFGEIPGADGDLCFYTFAAGGNEPGCFNSTGFTLGPHSLQFGNDPSPWLGAPDTFLKRSAAGALTLGTTNGGTNGSLQLGSLFPQVIDMGSTGGVVNGAAWKLYNDGTYLDNIQLQANAFEILSDNSTGTQIILGHANYSRSSITADLVTDQGGNEKSPSGGVKGWAAGVATGSLDTGLSRDSAGVVDCGNGTAGNKTCTFNAATYGAGTLGNGMIATTQSASDNSPKVATTAYFDRNFGVGSIAISSVGGIPAGSCTGYFTISVPGASGTSTFMPSFVTTSPSDLTGLTGLVLKAGWDGTTTEFQACNVSSSASSVTGFQVNVLRFN